MNKVVQAIIDALNAEEVIYIYKSVSEESSIYHFSFAEKNKVITDLNIIAAVEYKMDGVYVFVYDLLAMTGPVVEGVILYCDLVDDKDAIILFKLIEENKHLVNTEEQINNEEENGSM